MHQLIHQHQHVLQPQLHGVAHGRTLRDALQVFPHRDMVRGFALARSLGFSSSSSRNAEMSQMQSSFPDIIPHHSGIKEAVAPSDVIDGRPLSYRPIDFCCWIHRRLLWRSFHQGNGCSATVGFTHCFVSDFLQHLIDLFPDAFPHSLFNLRQCVVGAGSSGVFVMA